MQVIILQIHTGSRCAPLAVWWHELRTDGQAGLLVARNPPQEERHTQFKTARLGGHLDGDSGLLGAQTLVGELGDLCTDRVGHKRKITNSEEKRY